MTIKNNITMVKIKGWRSGVRGIKTPLAWYSKFDHHEVGFKTAKFEFQGPML